MMKSCRLCYSIVAATLFAGLLSASRAEDVSGPVLYKDPKLPVEQRVEDLLGRMTLEEKVDMLSGTGFESKPNARLGIPAIRMADGPQGVRIPLPHQRRAARASGGTNSPSAGGGSLSWLSGMFRDPSIPTTAFPSGVALAATWNPDLIERVGRTIGEEARILNKDMMLAPCVNIQRAPQGGRNFESYSEDPYLASRMAVAYIKGIQSQGVIATVKHFAANNQEFERGTISVKMDERVLREIYLPAFRAAVCEAGVWSVMSAYNKLNGTWCSENPYLLTEILKKEWGFKGFVVSDWSAVHSTLETANAGLDIEMPKGEFLNRELLLPLISSGKVQQAVIDDKIRRMLRAMFTIGLFEREDSEGGPIDTTEQRAIARAAATQSIVLLKNADGVLPLTPRKVHSIAMIGPNAGTARVGGGGSAMVRPVYAASPLDGIRLRAGTRFRVGYAQGCVLEGDGAEKITPEASDDLIQEAVSLAATSDVAFVFVGDSSRIESEGFDRKSLELPTGQNELIEAIAKTNKNTVVVLAVGAPILMGPWIDQVTAVVNGWFGGEEAGNAIADVLFGDVSPSGRLPVTFFKEWKDSPAYGRYPGENGAVGYDEGLYVGYRHFDKQNIEPQFPFGYGLSYTTFEYSNLKVTPEKVAPNQPVQVSLNVRNSGPRDGAEVVQLYVHDVQSTVDRPVKELKAFRKVVLKPGQTQTVSFTLDKNAMAFYDPTKKDWVAEPGAFEILVGASSRDIRLKTSFDLMP
ncbi:MAG TPA: glycoside hydrolase family 3 C-terminal domain-containing protein [Verrucomicrobiae bacterium]|nr:glycoside hydrolase family 3 C-terminal domain-containing protein [Verrucomicrobiae bacterium]